MTKNTQPIVTVKIKDCIVEAIASTGGNGGQNKNRRHTAIRITHPPSGARAESKEQRSQRQNLETAFARLAATTEMVLWLKVETSRRLGKPTPEEVVDRMMEPRNIKTETKDEKGRWTDVQAKEK